MEKTIIFRLNGKAVRLTTTPDRMLLWVLRSDLSITGTKYSCGEGFCGACTVLVNNEPVLSCQYPIQDAEGKDVLTIEGLRLELKEMQLERLNFRQKKSVSSLLM